MPVINTNVNAIIARNSGAVNDRNMTKAMQSLSTGKRINVAADDAAGLAIATKMTSQIRGLDQAVRNANDGISMLQVVEGATVEMTNMLQRMRELAVQSANDTNTDAERSYLDDEFQQLKAEIDRIAQTTQWNGKNVMDGTAGAVGAANTTLQADGGIGGNDIAFQVGANADAEQKITFNVGNFAVSAVAGGTAAKPQVSVLNLAGVSWDDTSGSEVQANQMTLTFSDGKTVTADFAKITAANAATAGTWTAVADALTTEIAKVAGLENVTVSAANGTLSISDTPASGDASVRTLSSFSLAVSATVSGVTTTTAMASANLSEITQTNTAGALSSGGSAVAGVFADANMTDVDIKSSTNAAASITSLDKGLKSLNQQRSAMGATINRLTYAADNLTNTSANVTAARSRVLDTDYASATTELARTQIIQQASTAMLAQANQGAQSVLSLLK